MRGLRPLAHAPAPGGGRNRHHAGPAGKRAVFVLKRRRRLRRNCSGRPGSQPSGRMTSATMQGAPARRGSPRRPQARRRGRCPRRGNWPSAPWFRMPARHRARVRARRSRAARCKVGAPRAWRMSAGSRAGSAITSQDDGAILGEDQPARLAQGRQVLRGGAGRALADRIRVAASKRNTRGPSPERMAASGYGGADASARQPVGPLAATSPVLKTARAPPRTAGSSARPPAPGPPPSPTRCPPRPSPA
jgi:hypothetical protein